MLLTGVEKNLGSKEVFATVQNVRVYIFIIQKQTYKKKIIIIIIIMKLGYKELEGIVWQRMSVIESARD